MLSQRFSAFCLSYKFPSALPPEEEMDCWVRLRFPGFVKCFEDVEVNVRLLSLAEKAFKKLLLIGSRRDGTIPLSLASGRPSRLADCDLHVGILLLRRIEVSKHLASSLVGAGSRIIGMDVYENETHSLDKGVKSGYRESCPSQISQLSACHHLNPGWSHIPDLLNVGNQLAHGQIAP